MAQKISQGNIFGRIGTSFGEGLGAQVPKEIEHYRRSQGFQDFAKNAKNMDTMEQFAALSSIYGATPQQVQTFGELAKQQNQRNSFKNGAANGEQQKGMQSSPEIAQGNQRLKDIQFANMGKDNVQRQVVQGDKIPSNFQNREEEAKSQPGVATENQAQNKFVPPISWTPAKRDEELGREWSRHPELSFDQVAARVADNERRALESPAEHRAQQEHFKKQEDDAEKEFDKQLETTLQKEGKQIYADVDGTTLLNVKKAMYHDLATDPELIPKTAAEKWVKKLKDFVDTQGILKTKANRDYFDKRIPSAKEETLNSLLSAQKLYAEMGNEKQFYEMLRSKNKAPVFSTNPQNGEKVLQDPGSFGFDLGPGGAALIAFPRSEPVKQLIKDYSKDVNKVSKIGRYGHTHNADRDQKLSRKFAEDFANKRSMEDSILAVAREAKDRNPNFDERAFFEWLREHENEYGFRPDQKNELVQGVSDITPNWGEWYLFPYWGTSKAHE